MSVADAYDTMTAARSYKRPMATRAAREELARCAGTQFDPVMVRAFLAISVPRLVWVSGPASFLVHLPSLWRLQRAGEQALGVASQAAAAGAVVTAAAVVIGGSVPNVGPGHVGGGAASRDGGAPTTQLSTTASTAGHGTTSPGSGHQGHAQGGKDPASGPEPSPEPTQIPPEMAGFWASSFRFHFRCRPTIRCRFPPNCRCRFHNRTTGETEGPLGRKKG